MEGLGLGNGWGLKLRCGKSGYGAVRRYHHGRVRSLQTEEGVEVSLSRRVTGIATSETSLKQAWPYSTLRLHNYWHIYCSSRRSYIGKEKVDIVDQGSEAGACVATQAKQNVRSHCSFMLRVFFFGSLVFRKLLTIRPGHMLSNSTGARRLCGTLLGNLPVRTSSTSCSS